MDQWRQVVFSSEANRCTPDFNVREDLKDVHRQHFLFLYSVLCLCCRFRLLSRTIHCNRRGVWTHMGIFEAFVSARRCGEHAVRPHTQNCFEMCWRVQTLVCCLREVQSHRQWPQCSSNRLTGTYQRTRAKVTVSPRPLCCLCTDQFLQIRFLTVCFSQFSF